uniref:Band 7 domain-containing protein n=1 Tax=Octopus bimaculoides TaxID=37653 RepID=A0A0L8G5V6_OCTBM
MSPKAIALCIGAVMAVAIIATLLATSMKKLQTYEVGLIYNKITKKLHDNPKFEGLHLGPPGFSFIIFPNVYQTKTFNGIMCLNQNGVRIILDVSCQFKIQLHSMKKVIKEFKDFEGLKRVNNIRRPKPYEKAIREKERAREDILVAKQERPKQLIEAETKMKEAIAVSNITLEKARSRARIKKKQAEAEASAIIIQYQKEAESLQNVLSSEGLNYTNEGFLQYMAIRIISSLNSPLHVGMNLPENPNLIPFRVLPPPIQ